MGIRRNPWYRIPTGSCPMSESVGVTAIPVGMPKFRHFATCDNFLSESHTKDSDEFPSDPIKSDNFSGRIRQDPPVGLFVLEKHYYGPHMPNADISQYLRIDESTVRYWLERYETTGDVEVQQKTGRSRSTTEKQDMVIKSMVAQHSTESAGQIAVTLSSKGIWVSKSTLRRRFKEAGIQLMKPTAKPLLNNDHIKKTRMGGTT